MQPSSLLIDFYELTMANSYFLSGKKDEIAYFDYFFRRIPDGGGYAVFAGLTPLIEYIETLRFTPEDIAFLRSKNIFSPGFLDYLAAFRFCGDIWAVPEGTVVFPNEPLLTVKAPLIDCQLIETFLLLSLNHQSLIATKAARMVHAARGKPVLELGARRAHGIDAANSGARAAYIGGVAGTANTHSNYRDNIPVFGTMAHAYVQSFANEYDAFLHYAQTYPENTVLLVDTYDTLRKGIPNAIKVYQQYLKPNGYTLKGIRIDSGDLAYLSNRAREMLDQAGLSDTQITVSNALDEYLIQDLILQGAAIDNFGVGERLITARSEPVFGGVYKIVATTENNRLIPKIKISENVSKTTTPGHKQLWRLYDQNNKAIADVITCFDETIDNHRPYLLFDPEYPWKQKQVINFRAAALLKPQIQNGKRVSVLPALPEIRAYCAAEQQTLWEEIRRLNNPHGYYVDLSPQLWQLKRELIEQHSGEEA